MNVTSLFDPWVSGRLCLTLMHSVWQVALVVMLVYAIGRLWGKQSVECRYWLHVAALIVAVTAVPLTYSLIEIPTEQLPKTVEVAAEPAAPLALPTASASGQNAVTSQTVGTNPVSLSNTTPNQPWSSRWLTIAPWLAGAYLIGVGLMTIRLTADIVSTERLRKTVRPIIEGPLAESLQRLSKKWHVVVMPMLAHTDHILVPKVIGLLRPIILIPTIALTGMSAAEMEMIIAHELAHVRRYDMWVNLLQRLAEVALFFNPALWYLSRRIGTLREYCCDEQACRMRNTDATARLGYATALVKVVELAKPSLVSDRWLSALAASGRSPSELRRRVARLVGEPLREPLRLTWGAASAIALSVIMLVFGTHLWTARAEAVERNAKDNVTAATETGDAKFAFGAQVNVLAIGSHAATPQRWWDTQGTLFPTVPFTWKESGKVSAQQQVWRRIVFRIDDLPKDADVTWNIVGAASSAGGEVLLDGGQKPKDYYTRYFSLPLEQKTFTLRIGIANGLWQTVTKASGALATGLGGKSILFSEALEVSEGTAVVISHNYFGQSFRIIAIDKQNQQHSSISQGGMSAGAIYQSRSTFPNVKPSNIDHFEFQVRDYEWVELKQLPSEPKVSDIGEATPGVDESSPEKAPSAKSIRILVTDAHGKPITGARVRQNHVHSPQGDGRLAIKNETYLTDSDGKAVVTWTGTSDDLRLWVTNPGFVPLHAMWSNRLQSDGNQIPGEFRFEMKPGTKIGGIVTNEKGEPIEGVKVEIMDATAMSFSVVTPDQPGHRPIRSPWVAEDETAVFTDSDGRWVATDISEDSDLIYFDPRRANTSSPPLRLRLSHPEYDAFDEITYKGPAKNERPTVKQGPSVESLRQKTATVELKRRDPTKSVDKPSPGWPPRTP